MTTTPTPAPVTTNTPDKPVHHLFCDCNPDVAYCGITIAGAPVVDTKPPSSQLCELCKIAHREGWTPCRPFHRRLRRSGGGS